MNHESNETHEYFENLTEIWEEKLNLLQLLQHFAVYTNQSQKSMNYLLKLLKAYEPAPFYSLLPNTGKELIAVDGRDISEDKSLPSRQPPATVIENGKYIHFGLAGKRFMRRLSRRCQS